MSEFALALFGLGCFLTVFAACRLVLQRAGGDTEWSPELHRSRILTLCGMLGDSAVDAAPPVFQAKVARDERLLQLAGLTPRYRGSDVLGMQALGLCVTLPLTLLVWDKIGAPAVLYPVLGITLPRWFFSAPVTPLSRWVFIMEILTSASHSSISLASCVEIAPAWTLAPYCPSVP